MLSWSINGRYFMLKNLNVRSYLNKFDFIFLCETHSTKEATMLLPGYQSVHNPCRLSKHVGDPRGGCVMFIKDELSKIITGSDISFNDAITIYLSDGYIILGIYIPPYSSPYFKDHIDYMETTIICAKENDNGLIICGDLNSRMGKLGSINDHSYDDNPDNVINQHGKEMLQIVQSESIIPLNLLNIDGKHFDGGFTFSRGDTASQNDWYLCNEKILPFVRMVRLHRDANMSDHLPISLDFEIDLGVSLTQIKQSITDVLHESNNHSVKPVIRMNEIKKETFSQLVIDQVENCVFDTADTDGSFLKLRNIFYDCAKRSRTPREKRNKDKHTSTTATPPVKTITTTTAATESATTTTAACHEDLEC